MITDFYVNETLTCTLSNNKNVLASNGKKLGWKKVGMSYERVHNERTSAAQTPHSAATYERSAYIIWKILTRSLTLHYF